MRHVTRKNAREKREFYSTKMVLLEMKESQVTKMLLKDRRKFFLSKSDKKRDEIVGHFGCFNTRMLETSLSPALPGLWI